MRFDVDLSRKQEEAIRTAQGSLKGRASDMKRNTKKINKPKEKKEEEALKPEEMEKLVSSKIAAVRDKLAKVKAKAKIKKDRIVQHDSEANVSGAVVADRIAEKVRSGEETRTITPKVGKELAHEVRVAIQKKRQKQN